MCSNLKHGTKTYPYQGEVIYEPKHINALCGYNLRPMYDPNSYT